MYRIDEFPDSENQLDASSQSKLLRAVALARDKKRVLVVCGGGNNRSRLLPALIAIDHGAYRPEDHNTRPVQSYYQKNVELAATDRTISEALKTRPDPRPSRKRRADAPP